MLNDFGIEIGTSFGPLHGKIWRIGAMGYNCQKHNILTCLNALETTLRLHNVSVPSGDAVDAAIAVYRAAGQ
jgi:(S)-ureidoglycine-glyoxylate aminotransferase